MQTFLSINLFSPRIFITLLHSYSTEDSNIFSLDDPNTIAWTLNFRLCSIATFYFWRTFISKYFVPNGLASWSGAVDAYCADFHSFNERVLLLQEHKSCDSYTATHFPQSSEDKMLHKTNFTPQTKWKTSCKGKISLSRQTTLFISASFFLTSVIICSSRRELWSVGVWIWWHNSVCIPTSIAVDT